MARVLLQIFPKLLFLWNNRVWFWNFYLFFKGFSLSSISLFTQRDFTKYYDKENEKVLKAVESEIWSLDNLIE